MIFMIDLYSQLKYHKTISSNYRHVLVIDDISFVFLLVNKNQMPEDFLQFLFKMLMAWSYRYNNKLMGARQPNPQHSEQLHEKPKPLTPLQRWNSSQKSSQDLSTLLSNVTQWSECGNIISTFLRNLNSRDKYQLCLSVVLEYFRNDKNQNELTLAERKELFTYYLLRLANSFFVVEDFHESTIPLGLTSKEKLFILYEYYSMNEQLMEKAVFFSYPFIFTELQQFTEELIEHEIVISNIKHFMCLVVNHDKIQIMRDEHEKIMAMLTRDQHEKSTEAMMQVHDIKGIYLSSAKQFMKCDNADHASLMFRTIVSRGYHLDEFQYDYWLKVELFGMFLYSLGKITLSFEKFKDKKVIDIIHLFYDSRNVEDTPQLIRCFEIFQDQGKKWRSSIMEYCFSPQAHISLFIRLKQHKYVNFDGSQTEFAGVLAKTISSQSQIGKYSHQLIDIADNFIIKSQARGKFIKLVKMVECLYVFGVNIQVEEVCPVIYGDINAESVDSVGLFQESGLNLFKMLIDGFFENPQTSARSIILEGTQYLLVNLYDLLTFLGKLRTYLLQNYLSLATIHHIIFESLLSKGYYSQLLVLLSNQNRQLYNIIYEPIELLVIDHIIRILTTKKIKKQQNSITMLMSAIGVEHRKQSTSHYIAAYYRYYKYLQDKYISLPSELKETVNMKHLQYILEQYGAKIDSIDFDYLFAQISSIRQQITQINGDNEPLVTDQFLKFKIQLSSRCFTLKKNKIGLEIIEEVMRYEPPWLGTALIDILKVNDNVDEQFIQIVFNHCTRGEDLAYLLKIFKKSGSKNDIISSSKLSLKNIKKFGDTLRSEKYVFLSNDLVTNQREYTNIVAQMTYSKSEQIRQQMTLFFKLLPCDVNRAFNYAVNYINATDFIVNFLIEGVKRDVIHVTNVFEPMLRYLYFKLVREERKNEYIKMAEYCSILIKELTQTVTQWEQSAQLNRSETFQLFKKYVKNYEITTIITPQFLQLYVKDSTLHRFMFDERQRKNMALQIREQPMNKQNSIILKKICSHMGVDIVDLSLYELFGRVNTKEDVDNEGWTVVQKMIFWGSNDRKVAQNVVKKMSQKIQSLQLLITILEYMRQSQPIYGQIVTEEHLQILSSLAAVEQDNNLFGIIPENYFDRSVGVYHSHPRGMLSEKHRKIIETNGSMTNIFVISKSLFFMYGCDPQIEKVILGQFSLRQEDSQQFQILRKKIKQ